jgi:hypothetical protein
VGCRQPTSPAENKRAERFLFASTRLTLGPISSLITFVRPDELGVTGEVQPFKRLQTERGRQSHDIWLTISDQTPTERVDDADMATRGLEFLTTEGSESKLQSRMMELEDELKRLYGAYGDLKGLHEKLWRKYLDEKMQ